MICTIEVPEIVALCRDDEKQAVGWVMVLPQTSKVVAHVPDSAFRARCCPTCTCAVVTELTARG